MRVSINYTNRSIPLSELGLVSAIEFERGVGNCFLSLREELKKRQWQRTRKGVMCFKNIY
jgi:hypothetical protein